MEKEEKIVDETVKTEEKASKKKVNKKAEFPLPVYKLNDQPSIKLGRTDLTYSPTYLSQVNH